VAVVPLVPGGPPRAAAPVPSADPHGPDTLARCVPGRRRNVLHPAAGRPPRGAPSAAVPLVGGGRGRRGGGRRAVAGDTVGPGTLGGAVGPAGAPPVRLGAVGRGVVRGLAVGRGDAHPPDAAALDALGGQPPAVDR